MSATGSTYPPDTHLLRDLGIVMEVAPGGHCRAWMPVTPEVAGAAGAPRAGALATIVDVVGGGLTLSAVQQGWAATVDLSLHLVRPVRAPAVEVRGRIARQGRRTLVLDATLSEAPAPGEDAAGPPVGEATMTFALLERRDTQPDIAVRQGAATVSFATPGSGLTQPFAAAIGGEVLDGPAGLVRLPIGDYVRNGLGALQGGVVAATADLSATAAAGAALGAPVDTVDLQISYLTLGREGPVEARAEVLGVGAGHATVRVDVVDAGLARRMAVATVVVVTAEGR